MTAGRDVSRIEPHFSAKFPFQIARRFVAICDIFLTEHSALLTRFSHSKKLESVYILGTRPCGLVLDQPVLLKHGTFVGPFGSGEQGKDSAPLEEQQLCELHFGVSGELAQAKAFEDSDKWIQHRQRTKVQ
jgi:hypothetical protein